MDRRKQRRGGDERGFALLFVFLMAAIVAITLYMELPRVAMQSQRDKEQMLIDRGEQYKRAIQLFVTKTRRYPSDIKDLESFQNQRFLRHRYQDPLTGKDEWRLVHVMNGMLTDSKVTKPTLPGGDKDKTASTPNGFVGEQVGLGGTQNQTQGGGVPSARDRRRPSEGNNATMPGMMGGQGSPGGDLTGGENSGTPQLPGQGTAGGPLPIDPTTGQPMAGLPIPGQPIPGQPIAGQTLAGQFAQQGIVQPGMPGQQGFPGQQGMPGQQGFPGQQVMPGQPGLPGQQGMPGQQGFPGQQGMPGMPAGRAVTAPGSNSNVGNSFVGGGGSFVGGGGSFVGGGTVSGSQPTYPGQTLPGQPGPPVNSQTGGVSPYPMQPGANGVPPGFPQPGSTTGQGNAAADMIRNILTTPRPGGMPQGNPGGQMLGGGIAGVASMGEGEGVKVYNERSLYQEWEFIFDPSKVKQIPNPNALGSIGTPADRMSAPVTPGQPGGTPGFAPQTPPQTGRPPGQ